jgi:hypothetical protein
MLQVSANNGNSSPEEIVVITWDTSVRYWPRANKTKFLFISCFVDIVSDFARQDHQSKSTDELHKLYSLPSIIRVMTSRRMRWVGYAARMGEKRNAYRILMCEPEGKTTGKTKT